MQKKRRGVAILEFSLVALVLAPLMLGTMSIGLNMIRTLQTVQLARDAGHMYARGTNFAQPGNQTILMTLGSDVGLTSSSTSKALVVLSTVTYVDQATCAAAGKVDSKGNPLGCTNYTKWVFTNRISVGNANLRKSNFGSPVTTGPNPVTIDASGNISLSDQTTNPGDVATFSGINPYANINGTVSGLPSRQVIYIAEAATTGMKMMPYSPSPIMYSYNMF
jgi:Flp pilus assembly protein TadG